jgi:hypothetical protein
MTTQIFTQISDLFRRLLSARRTGYSSKMKAIVKRTPGAVMVFATEKQAKEFGRQGISINNLAELDGKPGMVVVDNALLLHLLKESRDYVQHLRRGIDEQNRVLSEIHRMTDQRGKLYWAGDDGSGNGVRWGDGRKYEPRKKEFIPNFTVLRGRHVVLEHLPSQKDIRISIFSTTSPYPKTPYAPIPVNVYMNYAQFESLVDCIKSIENDK